MVSETLVMMNKVAIIAVVLVRKFPADLEDTKLSCDAPIPKAPPSDLCKRTTITNKIANIIFNVKTIFSMVVIYSNFSLYQ